MLVVKNLGHFTRVVAFARATGQLEQLSAKLWYLHTWAESTSETPRSAPELASSDGIPESWLRHASGSRNICELHSDHAAASFYFEMVTPTGSVRMNGGLIYHGSQAGWHTDGTKYTDPLSIRVASSDNPWSVHT